MYKIIAVILSVFSFISTNAYADADMFRTIEHFENDTIKNRTPYRSPIPVANQPVPPLTKCLSCGDLAGQYKDTVKHGEPVVSEDDY